MKRERREPVKYKGKIAPWYWAILIISNGMLLYFSAIGEERLPEMIIYALIADFVLLPPVFRNYVLLENNEVTVAFGFGKDTFLLRDITEIYPTRNPLAAAASLDRIVIKTKNSEFTCAVKKKEELLSELKKRNKKISIRESAKQAKKQTVKIGAGKKPGK